MRFVRYFVYTITALLAVLIALAFMLPRQLQVEETARIAGEPAAIYPMINNLRLFNTWSPWQGLDPDMQQTLSGPEAGVGATMAWSSEDPRVGTGRMEIIEAVEDRYIRTALTFENDDGAESMIRLEPVGEGETEVSWSVDMDLGYNPAFRYVALFLKGAIAEDYARGLARLKAVVEEGGAPAQMNGAPTSPR